MKKLTAFFLVFCMFTVLLCGCDKQTPIRTSTNETTAEQTSTTQTSGAMEYKLTVTGSKGELLAPYKDRYLPGEEVVLRAGIVYGQGIACYMNGEKLEPQLIGTYFEYRFIMPDTDVIFEIQTWGVGPPIV